MNIIIDALLKVLGNEYEAVETTRINETVIGIRKKILQGDEESKIIIIPNKDKFWNLGVKKYAEEIKNAIQKHKDERTYYKKFENIKENISYIVINKNYNEKLLETKVSKKTDIKEEFVYLFIIWCKPEEFMIITYEMLEQWGITEEELWNIAENNKEKYNKPLIEQMKGLIMAIMPDPDFPKECIDDTPYNTFVISTCLRYVGAAAFFDKKVIDDLLDKFGKFIMLPSSIHEVIIIVGADESQIDFYSEKVKEVNEAEVKKAEWLGEKAYYFEKK